MDATTTEAQLSVRAPPVVMSSLLLVLALDPGLLADLALEPRDLLGVLSEQ